MSFNKGPKIDSNSRLSNKSINRFKHYFSEENGFLVHDIDGNNDFGVDAQIQLIKGHFPQPFYVPVQVKSSKNYPEKALDQEVHKTFRFDVGQLGFLHNHKPTTGLIVIYDEKEDKLYSDFTFKIIARLMGSLGNENWKGQVSVTLSIPQSNEINAQSIKELHDVLDNIQNSSTQLFVDRGRSYDLPVDYSSKSTFDFLIENGELMFNGQYYAALSTLIDKLERKEYRNPTIAFLGAITYAEIGDTTEAEYFFNTIYRFESKLNETQREILKVQNLKHHYHIGKFNQRGLSLRLKELIEEIEIDKLKIQLGVVLIRTELLQNLDSDEFDYSFYDRVVKILHELESLKEKGFTYHLQLISAYELISKIVTRSLMDLLIDVKIFKEAKKEHRTPELYRKSKWISDLNNKITDALSSSMKYAIRNEEDLLLAHSQFFMAMHYFDQFYAYYFSKNALGEDTNDMISHIYNLTISSYNTFKKMRLEPLAYQSIILCKEINLLSKHWLNYDLEHILKASEVDEHIKSFEDYDFYQEYDSLILKTADSHERVFKPDFLKQRNLNDHEIKAIVNAYMRLHGLPKDRANNIAAAVKASSEFNQRCKDDNLILFSDQPEDGTYETPPKFTVFSKNSSILVAEGYDIESILRKLGY